MREIYNFLNFGKKWIFWNIGGRNFEIRSFLFLKSLDYGNLTIEYQIFISTFFVEFRLKDVLEVVLVVGSEIYLNET